MSKQHSRAEILDRFFNLLAVAALPFAAIMVLDSLQAGGAGSGLVDALDWIAKGALALVTVWMVVLIIQKWRAGGGRADDIESFSISVVLKAAGVSWFFTFSALIRLDRLYQGEGLLGIAELPVTHAGDVMAAFMLVVFSITYFGLVLSARLAEARVGRNE